ncbi:MAG: iron (metal) dependent repressor, DtxR family [Rubrobacteraceae bacterium]|jgi:DtxR family Mn-dependent transcriptional regulator|nr:iron (metal) dependent repressor, DtxR family [Rubrobacteraceae bacterium]
MDVNGPTATKPPSTSVGDYLKAIWEVGGSGAASTTDVADRLSVASASVTNMFARLQEMGLAKYERYRGASLTERGREEALRLVRRHRLLETFLLEHLGYSWQEVHEEAERLEHAVSDGFTERLAAFLGHPDQDPHGAPIPAADGTLAAEESFPLDEVPVGDCVRISRVKHEDAAVLSFLGERELVPGRLVEVKEVRALDGVVTVEDEDGVLHSLGRPLVDLIFVRGVAADVN